MLSIIVAADEQNVIGKDNVLIWHLPDDLKFFKKLTSGHSIIMGRKTFESIGRPLPDRRNIIITRDRNFKPEGCNVLHSVEEAISHCANEDQAFIVGGEQIYRLAMPFADRVYLTRIHHSFEGDRHFPALDAKWIEVERSEHRIDDKHAYSFTFITYEKR